MNLANWLVRAGLACPDLPAVGFGFDVYQTYGVLAARAAWLSGALGAVFGLTPGSRVAVVTANCPQYLEIIYGIWHGGYAAVPINAKLHPSEVEYILEHSGASLCFAGGSLTGALREHNYRLVEIGGPAYERLFSGDAEGPTAAGPEELAWLFYTSGTTGRPKGAMLSHRNLITMSLAYLCDVDPVSPGDAILHAAPMSHGSGLYTMAHLARRGLSVVPESGS